MTDRGPWAGGEDPAQPGYTPAYAPRPAPGPYSQELHLRRLGRGQPPAQAGPAPQYQAPPGQPYDAPAWQGQPPAPRRRRRVFLWVFLAVQALFIIWIVAGLASSPGGPSTAQQAAQQCANGGWQGLFKSQADCQQHYAVALNDAGNLGKGLGVAFIVIVWMVTDFFLGLGYGIYRLASRR